MNLDAIFLDKLEQKCCKKPRVWSPYGYYLELLELTENFITLDYNGFKRRYTRGDKKNEQKYIWPNQFCKDWNKWREYLFEDRVDFIAPLSYILQSETGNCIHLTETVCKLPYLLLEAKNGKVLNAKGEILTIDINKYRYANQREIDAFLDIASTFINIEWIKNKEIWSWATYYTTEAKPKFIPGDLVSIKDYITGDIFEGCYIISDIIEVEEGKYSYKLISDSFFAMKLIEVIVEEDKLVKCEVIVNKEKPNIETETKTEKPKEEIKEDKVEIVDDDFLL
jgi:hypothetical protein